MLKHYWRGRSGRLYEFLVLPVWLSPGVTLPANYLYAQALPSGLRDPKYWGETDNLDRRWHDHANGLGFVAQLLGADELHVCFEGRTGRERLDIETDLRNRHATPLNMQPSKAAPEFTLADYPRMTRPRSMFMDPRPGVFGSLARLSGR